MWHIQIAGEPRCAYRRLDVEARMVKAIIAGAVSLDTRASLVRVNAVIARCTFDTFEDALDVARVLVEHYPTACVVSGACTAWIAVNGDPGPAVESD